MEEDQVTAEAREDLIRQAKVYRKLGFKGESSGRGRSTSGQASDRVAFQSVERWHVRADIFGGIANGTDPETVKTELEARYASQKDAFGQPAFRNVIDSAVQDAVAVLHKFEKGVLDKK